MATLLMTSLVDIISRSQSLWFVWIWTDILLATFLIRTSGTGSVPWLVWVELLESLVVQCAEHGQLEDLFASQVEVHHSDLEKAIKHGACQVFRKRTLAKFLLTTNFCFDKCIFHALAPSPASRLQPFLWSIPLTLHGQALSLEPQTAAPFGSFLRWSHGWRSSH